MNKFRPLAFALSGWIACAIFIVGIGILWPTVFPAILNNGHYYGIGPALSTIVILAIAFASPAGFIGGLIGSKIPKEGGATEQYLMAGIMGIVLAMPFACMGLWSFTGW